MILIIAYCILSIPIDKFFTKKIDLVNNSTSGFLRLFQEAFFRMFEGFIGFFRSETLAAL